MGRINLSALRVRRRALQNLDTKRTDVRPAWVDIMSDIPPAQVFTRQQPVQHAQPWVRTISLPDSRTKAIRLDPQGHQIPGPQLTKASRMYSPTPIKYDEDALRKQFFSDHPWELARPRVILETSGDQYAHVDWSTGISQPGVPLSGECVVQRQLWLLQNLPRITIEESYDIARREFYALRRREATARRIAVEEAQNMGAEFGPSDMAKAMGVESKMYNDWERWAEQMNMENDARNASFSGQVVSVERKALEETRQVEGGPSGPGATGLGQPGAPGRPASMTSARVGAAIGHDVFVREGRRKAEMGR